MWATESHKELDLEEDELEGENIASLVSLDHMRELPVAHFRPSLVVKLCKTVLLHQLQPKNWFISHPGQSFSLSLCGPISICRANAHMVYRLKHQCAVGRRISRFTSALLCSRLRKSGFFGSGIVRLGYNRTNIFIAKGEPPIWATESVLHSFTTHDSLKMLCSHLPIRLLPNPIPYGIQ